MARLTEKAISAARAGTVERFLWDGETPGFGCRIKPSGVKTFLVQYRIGTRTRRLKIGRWPIWKVELARRKAQKLLGEVDEGCDPSERQRRDRISKGNTVSAVAAAFIELHAKARGRRSWRESERSSTSTSTHALARDRSARSAVAI